MVKGRTGKVLWACMIATTVDESIPPGGDVVVAQEQVQRVAVDLPLKGGMDARGLQLRAEEQHPFGPSVIERFDPQSIADQVEAFLPPIPNGDGEHADEALYGRRDAPFFEGGQHHFGIGAPAKAVSQGHQFWAEAGIVVDLAVEDHDEAPAGGEHRLMAFGGGIEDGPPSEPPPDAGRALNPGPLSRGAAR